MEIDYEKAWVALKAEIVKQRSHGSAALALKMAQIEVDCRVPEGQQGFDPTPRPRVQNGSRQQPAHEVPSA